MRKRVYLYIIKNQHLLVLRHVDFPELGLQIPGGTVEPDEKPIDAAAREAFEETGLATLSAPDFLATTVVQSLRSDESTIEAWYYRLCCVSRVPELWHHTELDASGGSESVRFELSWLPMSTASRYLCDTDCLMLDSAAQRGQ